MGNVSVKVTGMTCGHCSSAVHDEVAKVSGVTAVEVELDDGTVTIQTDGSVDSDAIRHAVEDAGYQLAG